VYEANRAGVGILKWSNFIKGKSYNRHEMYFGVYLVLPLENWK